MKYFKPKSMERYILRTPGAFIKILKYQIFTVIVNVKNELQNVYEWIKSNYGAPTSEFECNVLVVAGGRGSNILPWLVE